MANARFTMLNDCGSIKRWNAVNFWECYCELTQALWRRDKEQSANLKKLAAEDDEEDGYNASDPVFSLGGGGVCPTIDIQFDFFYI